MRRVKPKPVYIPPDRLRAQLIRREQHRSVEPKPTSFDPVAELAKAWNLPYRRSP